jgi:hypothetical protein
VFAPKKGFPVKPVGQRPLSHFGKSLLQLSAGSDENLDDGDVVAAGQRVVLRAQRPQATGVSYSAAERASGSAPRSISRETIRGSPIQAA